MAVPAAGVSEARLTNNVPVLVVGGGVVSSTNEPPLARALTLARTVRARSAALAATTLLNIQPYELNAARSGTPARPLSRTNQTVPPETTSEPAGRAAEA